MFKVTVELAPRIFGDLVKIANYNNESIESYVVSALIKCLVEDTKQLYKEDMKNVK